MSEHPNDLDRARMAFLTYAQHFTTCPLSANPRLGWSNPELCECGLCDLVRDTRNAINAEIDWPVTVSQRFGFEVNTAEGTPQ